VSAEEARVLAVAQAAPGRVLDAAQRAREVERALEFAVRIEPEQGRMHTGDERRERGRGDLRETAQHTHVVDLLIRTRLVRDEVVADQQSERLAAGHAELGVVDLLEQVALVELDGAFDVLTSSPGSSPRGAAKPSVLPSGATGRR
jgi:hypothetical protein